MRPFTVILGIALGSTFAIAFGLAVVLGIFWLLRTDYPRLASELPELLRAAGLFSLVTVFAAAAFLGSLRRANWRHLASLLLGLSLLLVGWYYWPA